MYGGSKSAAGDVFEFKVAFAVSSRACALFQCMRIQVACKCAACQVASLARFNCCLLQRLPRKLLKNCTHIQFALLDSSDAMQVKAGMFRLYEFEFEFV